jgi:hypothetical protein
MKKSRLVRRRAAVAGESKVCATPDTAACASKNPQHVEIRFCEKNGKSISPARDCLRNEAGRAGSTAR